MLPAIENPFAGAVIRYSFSRPPLSGFFGFYTILLGYLEIRFRWQNPSHRMRKNYSSGLDHGGDVLPGVFRSTWLPY
jgi:hypothetical protein